MATRPAVRVKSSEASPAGWRSYWPIALIVVLAFVAFAPALQATWIWDDDQYVTENHALRSAAGLWRIWSNHEATPQYYPLVFTTFWLEYHAYGLSPVGYHVVNVLLHAATACGLYLVLRRLRLPGAGLAAVLFTVHPMMAESVAWVTERKNVLSGCLYFASAWCLLRSRAVRIDDDDERRVNLPVYAGAVVLFLGALLSKSVTGSLPAAALLVVYWKRGRVTWPDVAWLLPLFALALPLGLHTAWLERHHVGAEGPKWVYGPTRVEDFLARCVIAGRAVWFYVGKFFWPADLAFIYSRFRIDTRAPWQWLFPAAAAAVVVALFVLRNRIGRGPVVAVLFFIGTALPALGFFDVFPHQYSFVADHFVYLALVGLIALTAAGAAALYHRLKRNGRRALGIGGAVLMLLLIVQTARQCLIYENAETLWRDTLAKSPDAWVAHTNYGATFVTRGEFEAAVPYYERALQLEPGVHDTHYHWGQVLDRRGQPDEAEKEYRAALRIFPKHPPSLTALGDLLLARNDLAEAEKLYQAALAIMPAYAHGHFGLGQIREQQGRTDEALEHYRQAVLDEPREAVMHKRLGDLWTARKDYANARVAYSHVVALQPNNPDGWTRLAACELFLGRPREATYATNRALQIDPTYEPARAVARLLQALQRR